MFLAPATSFSCPHNYTFFYYYKQLGLELQKTKQLLGLKHVTISNFANKILRLHYITTYLFIIQMSFFFLIS